MTSELLKTFKDVINEKGSNLQFYKIKIKGKWQEKSLLEKGFEEARVLILDSVLNDKKLAVVYDNPRNMLSPFGADFNVYDNGVLFELNKKMFYGNQGIDWEVIIKGGAE